MYKFFKENGFSLVEILIVLGMIGGVSLALMRTIDMITSQNKRLEANQEILFLFNEMKAIVSDKKTCTETFKNLRASQAKDAVEYLDYQHPLTGESLKKFQTSKSAPSATYGNARIKIKSYELSDDSNEVSVEDESTTQLKVEFDRGALVKPQFIKKSINLYVKTNSIGQIESCGSSGIAVKSFAKDICETMDGRKWDSSRKKCALDISLVDPKELEKILKKLR